MASCAVAQNHAIPARAFLGLVLTASCVQRSMGFTGPAAHGIQGDERLDGVLLVSLEQHKSPVHDNDNGKVLAHRISYLGSIRIGAPRPQEFKVIFDTGSGQVIVPSSRCSSLACKKHQRFDVSASSSAKHVQMDGSLTPSNRAPEQATIQFGQGKVSGEMVRDRVCVGSGAAFAKEDPEGSDSFDTGGCFVTNAVVATELSRNPWAIFSFDGIVGLGMESLAITDDFHFFRSMYESGQLGRKQFGLYLAETGEGSELALGGANPKLLDSPLQWVPVALPEQGHWQVTILGFHIGDFTLDLCRRGGCKGVVDSGTSHIAIPDPYDEDAYDLLSVLAGDRRDCRFIEEHPPIVIELEGLNLTLWSEDYMRSLPLPADMHAGATSSPTHSRESGSAEMMCRPRIVGVNLPPSIGAKTFILGQPLFHRYYTVFNFDGPQMGFGLAAPRMAESSWTREKAA